MKIYLDNAATTPIHPEVVDAMIPMLRNQFGNPSSIHGYGREVRSAIEAARKNFEACGLANGGVLEYTSASPGDQNGISISYKR